MSAPAVDSHYTVVVEDVKGRKTTVVEKATPVAPPPGSPPSRTNLSFEPAIHETACAVRGDIVYIENLEGRKLYQGCLFPHERHGGKKCLAWYAEKMLLTGLVCADGSPSVEYEMVAFFVDYLDRINDVRLIPKGCAVDDHDEEFDPDLTPNSPSSPRQKRMAAAFEDSKQGDKK